MNFNTEFICKLSFFLVSFLFSRQKKYKDKSRQITSDWSQVIQILFLLLSNFNFPAKNDCNWRKTQKLISKLEVYISLYLLLLSFQFSAKKNSSNRSRTKIQLYFWSWTLFANWKFTFFLSFLITSMLLFPPKKSKMKIS